MRLAIEWALRVAGLGSHQQGENSFTSCSKRKVFMSNENDDEDWSPAIGWRKAITKILIRAIIFVPLAAAGMLILLFLVRSLDLKMMSGRLVMIIALLPGIVEGWVMSRDMVDSTGIDGKALIMPAAAVLAAMGVLMFFGSQSVFAIFDPHLQYMYYGTAAIAAIVLSSFKLYLE